MSFPLSLFQPCRLISVALLSLLVTACASYQTPVAQQSNGNAQVDIQSVEGALAEQPALATMAAPSALTESLLTNLLIANLALNAREYQLASDAMVKAADEFEDILLIEKAARFALFAKQYPQAIDQGQAWIALDPSNHLSYLMTSVAAIEGGKRQLAIQLLTQMVELNPENYAATYRSIGEVYLQHSAGLKGLEVAKEVAMLHPELVAAWMLRAAIAQRVRNKEDLIYALDKALTIDPHNERAALLKVGALQVSSLDELNQFAGPFSENHPRARLFKIVYGRELLKRKQNALALEQFVAILAVAPKNAQALNLTALVYHSLGDFENSAAYFERHLAVRPDDDQSRVYLASALHQLGRLDEANETVKTIKDDLNRFNSYRQIAMYIEESQGTDEGITYLKAIETQSQDQQIQLIADQSQMLMRAKRTQQELELLNSQLIAFPESTLLRYQRALLYVELKNIAAHEKDMRVLIEQESENAHYHNTLGYSLLLEEGRLDDAQGLINKAHTLKPEDPYILDSKGWLEFKLGNAKAAILYLNQAYKIDPDPEIAAHLGEVHWSLGEQQKAENIWLEAKEIDAENNSLNEAIQRFIK